MMRTGSVLGICNSKNMATARVRVSKGRWEQLGKSTFHSLRDGHIRATGLVAVSP